MRHIQTDILVIGGGATGTGILRDLAMRGYKCLLVERRDLAYGTTGRFHGLLHSGGRYVVNDPLAARDCIEENRILRRIMPQCIEDTGGFFVLTPQDDPTYVPLFLNGCHAVGIPVETIAIRQMLKQEPLLDPKIQQCFHVSDASADSFLATDLNAESARQHGAQILTYHEVINLTTRLHSSAHLPSVKGALCHDLVKDEDVQIDADLVVNASGAWVGKIANMVDINLQMLPGKGTLVALNHRVVNTVINRCKLPSDGDILVPAHTVAIMGTTDIRTADPDHYSIEPWEIRLMLDEGEKIIPLFKQFRILRAWAGIRPLIHEGYPNLNRDISRSFTLLDHKDRDGVDGFITITGGKWTTYRKMAEVTVDLIGERFKVNRLCRTHLEILPSKHEANNHHLYLGGRLKEVENEASYGQLVCECELTTQDEVVQAIIQANARTIDDIRRDVRLGMGPCQGAYCAFRVAGMLHDLRHPPIEETNVSLRDFLQERWKGNLPVLWGQQLRQERFNELVYINNLNADNLPGENESKLAPEHYSRLVDGNNHPLVKSLTPAIHRNIPSVSQPTDVVVIGAGLSGLIAAWQACIGGLKVQVITKGWGATYWSSGCIDILGYKPPNFSQPIKSPGIFLEEFIKSTPDHPYARVGVETLEKAVISFLNLCRESDYPYYGSLNTNLYLPTALGTLRPTCLAPMTMTAGDASQPSPMLIVGFSQFHDFYPSMVADNLNKQGILARDISLDLESLHIRKFVSGSVLARLFDDPEFRQEVIDVLKPKLGNVGRVGFPAVLGLNKTAQALQHLETALGIPVFEIPGLPPSIPGIRLHNMIFAAIENHHGSIFNGMSVSSASTDNNLVTTIWSDAAARQKSHPAKYYVLATGGILGGGITTDENGDAQESIFGFPIDVTQIRSQWFQDNFLAQESHPIHSAGLDVNPELHPITNGEQVIYQNLYAVGSVLGNCDPIRERSLEGIALATGFKVGENLSQRAIL